MQASIQHFQGSDLEMVYEPLTPLSNELSLSRKETNS